MKKIVGKNTIIFSIVSFFTDLSSEMIFPLLPLFLVSVLGTSQFEIGIIESAAVGAIAIFSLISASIIGKIGNEKRTAILGYSFSSFMKIGFYLASGWIHILIVRFLERSGKGVRAVARDVLLIASEDKKKWGMVFGIRQVADMSGKILGPLLASVLLYVFIGIPEEEAYRNVFLIAAAFAIFPLPLLFFLKHGEEPAKNNSKGIIRYILSKENRGMLTLIAIVFIASFSEMFFILRAADVLPAYIVPLAYIGYGAMFAMFSVPAGILNDRTGTKKMFILALLIYILTLILFGYLPSMFSLFLGFVMLGMFNSIIEISAKMLALKNSEQEKYKIVVGAYHSISKISKIPSNMLAGILWVFPLFSAPSTFAFGIVVSVIALVFVIYKIK
ncbi:MAG: MFS transporter [Candidatus ainarchaeum sp.]|nr:MFS transporter [Candidatus ainarchaeum sp.]